MLAGVASLLDFICINVESMELLSAIAPDGAAAEQPGFLRNSGSVGALLHSIDWSASPLGPPEHWTPALKTLMATVLPASAQIVLFWGPQLVALYNDAYAPTIGTKHPRALGRPGIENWSELWDDLEPLLRGVLTTGETFSAKDRPFYIERHDLGETVYFDVSYSAVREADGSIGGVLCIVTETTERVQFERRQAFLLELGQTLPSIRDPDQIQSITLRKLAEALGASRAFFGENHADGSTFEVRQSYSRVGGSAVGRHAYRDFGEELPGLLRNGHTVLREDIASEPGRSAEEAAKAAQLGMAATIHVPVVRHHHLEAVLAIHYDQPHAFSEHERKLVEETAKLAWMSITHARAEAALRSSSAQLSAMFDQASAGIAVCDHTWHFTRVNDRYCEIVGRSRATLLGLRMLDIVHPDDLANLAPLVDHGIARSQSLDITERYSRPDGTPVWVQNQITPLKGPQAGVLCVSVDISERVRAEEDLRQLNEGLEERVMAMVGQREAAAAQLHEARKMEMIGQLTGGIAHDFNNLLTPIMASLELIRRRLDDERSTRLIDGALQAADRARILVGRLLTFARRQTLKPQNVALAQLVNDMRDLIERSLGPTIDVAIDVDDHLPAVVVDPHQLELAILNLAVNARDAMESGGRLEISAAPDEVVDSGIHDLADGRYLCLTVTDTGTGMSDETLSRCVEPFFSTKGVGKGTGLGLSMVQGLAAQSGGGFGISSHQGMGTRISIWLPLASGDPASASEASTEAPVAPRPTHVLLVDDEAMVRHTTALQLGDLGYQVTEACSAKAALDEIEAGLVPDVLITDHVMADKNGAQFAQELRQRIPSLPVLIITGYANLTPAQMQGFEVLAKPYRRAELAARLARLLSPDD